MREQYEQFLSAKSISCESYGIEEVPELNPMLFDFQKDIVRWSLKRGRSAIFADCGLGKTPMQLEWARVICEVTGGNVLILAPLAVAAQTVREGHKFGIAVHQARKQADVVDGITIANYEMLDHFDASSFVGIVLDESSILKNYSGKFRNQIIDSFKNTPYRLACTATPAPNDHMELGNHAEFLGAMSRTEMLSMFFVHDGGDTAKWRIKGHAEDDYWKWVCSWAVMLRNPSDLGYDSKSFTLPELSLIHHEVDVDESDSDDGLLFRLPASTLIERRTERRLTIEARAAVAAELANASDESWLIWCDLNTESEACKKLIRGAVEVRGSDTSEHKEKSMLGFSSGDVRVLVTKPSIAGFGMNWQHCHNVAFVGLSDSYEQYYQAIRRCWRFGQTNPVKCHIITASTEGAVVRNIERKERDAMRMASEMVKHMHVYNEENIKGLSRDKTEYKRDYRGGDGWDCYLGDCIDITSEMESNSIHYSIFSPPFASLYTYSNSERDMGNCNGYDDFSKHFAFLVQELHRVMMPGRLVSFHCTNIPMMKERDGVIGIRDFRGALIRCFENSGFVYHSEVTIWKDPVTAMQRTKALGLLHKQLKKDSCMSRQGIADYLVTMRKRGDNPERVEHTNESFPVHVWQRYASPVWMDINPSRTLQKESAREERDERHICPLQLDVIERAIQLWTNPGDIVFSPFGGIGSEGYCAVKMGRRAVLVELKESYWKQACANLENAVIESRNADMFGPLQAENKVG